MNPNSYLTEIFAESQSPILFIDFDGTISKRDVIDRILEEFADSRWLNVEEKWLNGEIGSRECLQEQFSFVKAPSAELNEFLDTLELDEGFAALLDVCLEANLRVHIVSDGFDYYIRRLLDKNLHRAQTNAIKIWANRLIPHGRNRWRTQFPYFRDVCADGCATCKPRVMREQNRFAAPSIFVGDGLSDRFAAKAATIVFAKNKLSEFCLESGIQQTAFSTLKQVADSLDEAFESFVLNLYKERQWQKAA